jgi:hypothetical protein
MNQSVVVGAVFITPAFRVMAGWENQESGRDEYCPYHLKGWRLIYNRSTLQIRRTYIMSTMDPKKMQASDMDDDEADEEDYEDMDLLERLETLREDMEELGVTTLAEVIRRIEELHRKLNSQTH